jgi:branched-chain amino acid transport system permease protein
MLQSILPAGSRRRTVAVVVLATVALLIVTQFVLPGGTANENGTPAAILFFGGVTGLINALTAVGIILIYRTNRIINFAQAAIGAAGAIFAYNCMVALNWPFPLAFATGVVIGAALGLAVDIIVVKRFFNAPRLLLTGFTIALLSALFLFAVTIVQFPIFGDAADRSLADRLGRENVRLPFEDFSFRIGDTALDFGFGELFAIGMCALTFAGVAFFLYRTKVGVAVRAAAENTERASLLGIPIKLMSSIVWAVAGAVSAVGLLLLGTVTDFTSVGGGGIPTLIRALAAAVLARMRSIPVAIAAAVGIEVADRAMRWSYPGRIELVDLGLLIIVVVSLLIQTRERRRGDEGETGTWKTIEEFRPIPRELASIPGVRFARWGLIALFLGAILLIPWVLSIGATNQAGRVVIWTIVLLSLVVLTGWAGQVSLGQFGLVAIGAVVGGAFTARLGVAFWLAVPAVSLFCALFALVLGLTSLRIRGFYLGVTTLAFAGAVQAMLFKEEYFGWLLPERVDRPTAFIFDFEDERSMYYLAVAGLLLALLIVTGLRRTRSGRVLIGLRENEPNAQSFGINVVRTRLGAFALSGFLAGYAGVLLAHHQRAIDQSSYATTLSLRFFVIAVVAGVGSTSGAVIGGVYLGIETLLAGVSGPVTLLIGVVAGPIGLLLLLYVFPRGLSSIAFGLRDGVLRIVAQRRRLVVPSLFADYDPTAMERQLAPLGEPDLRSGLAALPADRRYRRSSVLYRQEADGERRRDEDAKALQAAAQSAWREEEA